MSYEEHLPPKRPRLPQPPVQEAGSSPFAGTVGMVAIMVALAVVAYFVLLLLKAL